jgi:hypothetical protein
MGVLDHRLFAFFVVAHALALASCLWAARVRTIGGPAMAAATFSTWLATCSLGLVFGPLVLLPTVVAATMASILLHPRQQSRVLIIAGYSALVLVPITLELAGAIGRSYVFDNGVMTMIPRMVRFTEGPTLLALIFGSMATILTLAFVVTRLRTNLTRAEEHLQLHAWQLRQLVP